MSAILLALSLLAPMQDPRHVEPVPVTFKVIIEEGEPIADGAVLTLSGRDEEKAISLKGGEATLLLVPGPWDWHIEDPGIESSPHPVLVQRGVPVIELNVRRLAPLVFRLEDEDANASRVTISTGPGSEARCVRRDDAFECMVPIGTRPLRLRVSGWKPVDLGTLGVPRSGIHIGTVELPSRASIAGTVEGDTVRLRLLRESEMRRGQTGIETVPDARGRFEFPNVAPGIWWIEGESESGTVERWGPYELEDARVVIREPLILEAAGEIELQVVPPRDPMGDPWKVSLVPVVDDFLAAVESLEFPVPDDIGRVSSGPIPPGRYIIRITFHDSGATFGRRVVDVPSEATVIEQMILEPVRLRARVLVDDEPVHGGMVEILPLEAEVNIGPDGHFETYLPAEGQYTFDLMTLGNNVIRRARVVRDSSGDARLDIDATVTQLTGVVLGPDGEVMEADVTVRWPGFEKVLRTEDGYVSFDVPRHTGRVELRAMTSRRSSFVGEWASPLVALRIDATPVAQKLEMVATQQFEVSADAHVAFRYGARDIWDIEYASREPVALRIPADIEALTICALPRESALSCERHRVSSKRTRIDGSDAWGELVLDAHGALVPSEVPAFRLYHEGALVPMDVIEMWTAAFGIRNPVAGRILLPRIAAGDIRVCAVSIEDDGDEVEGSCVSGVVRADERTTLEIPLD